MSDELELSPRNWPEVGAVLPAERPLPDSDDYVYDEDAPEHAQPDNGTMPRNVAALEAAVIGRRIVSAEVASREVEDSYFSSETGLRLTLDNGTQVWLHDTSDCCAYTALQAFFLDPESYDHAITGVKTADGYTRWFIFAELTDVLKLKVGWRAGNPFYYGYGFSIAVIPLTLDGDVIAEDQKEIGR